MVVDAPSGVERPGRSDPRVRPSHRLTYSGQAADDEAREGGVVVRPFLENSTACRKSVPSNTPSPGPPVVVFGVGFLWLIDSASASTRGSQPRSNSSTESLILAQDERWRRA